MNDEGDCVWKFETSGPEKEGRFDSEIFGQSHSFLTASARLKYRYSGLGSLLVLLYG